MLPPEMVDRVSRVFENARIETRYLAQPVAWYLEPHGHEERAAVYLDVGLDLVEQAASAALQRAELEPRAVKAIVLVSTTGTATPSLDARLCNRMGFPDDVLRLPVWGLGCAGGVAGLNLAAKLAHDLAGPVLLVSMELCSINLDMDRVLGGSEDGKKASIAAALFGDGCAAAVLAPDGDGPLHVAGRSHLFPQTEWVMGWDVTDRNLEVVLSPEIPGIVAKHMPDLVQAMLAPHNVARPDAWILHPGGAKIVDAYQAALGLSDEERAWTDGVLRGHGNMSSPTVLFCLDAYLRSGPEEGQNALLAALGPGFASEMALVRT